MANDQIGERERQRQEGRREGDRSTFAWLFGFIAGLLVLALMGSAYVIGFNRGQDDVRESEPAQPATTQAQPEEPAPAGPGLDLFVETCGSCHTLAAANTTGTIGPDLDDLTPSEAQVLAAIENGGTGSGAMPAGLLSGAEAQQVAAFVADSAGQ